MGEKSRKGILRIPFEDRYNHFAFPEPNSGCYIWMGHLDKNGYGTMKIGSLIDGTRRTTWAHIAAYEHFVGPVPKGLDLDHKCRVTCCVNPEHLEPVTHLENCRRGRAGATVIARLAAQTHCKRGHLLSGENLAIYDGARCCRTCRKALAKKYYDERRSRGEAR